ncbi:aminoglycoside phosphotransferase family protein [Halopseudomonas salegens]|uniref:Aminoglycoside phosphotransferase domain-containing protein n=1 Tax=Halopseudomonas salegens TaxID=1434072 RepID=A0A1H2DX72_9GAMM|nr:phosphotransferase [Halopseudomonas salegens]SDT87456.1 hypothetical protein SAMN05216210_0065 [Halopseudomonas salegens]
MMDAREVQLRQWLPAAIAQAAPELGPLPAAEPILSAASADASARRYFRWQQGDFSLIIMDAPPEQEDSRPFVRIAELMTEASVRVPRIFVSDLQQGFLLLEDMGQRTFLEQIQAGIYDSWLEQLFSAAIDSLVRWQQASRPGVLPPYDSAVLQRELELFPDWYVARHLQCSFSEVDRADWAELCQLLLASINAETRVFVHRDYMARNLMVPASGEPAVLDFQDALYGPASYDATSLFADAFFSWPEPRRDAWMHSYWQRARAAGIELPGDYAVFQRQYRLMGVQRHLKVLGIFARISYRDGKPRYLDDAPRFLAYLQSACQAEPELAPLQRLLARLELTP